jgi:hypothetical protein
MWIRARTVTMLGVVASLSIASAARDSAQLPAEPAAAQPARPRVRPAPTDAERARLLELAARDKAWATRAAAELTRSAETEGARFLERRAATLRSRNDQIRAELTRRARAADSPAARAEARRVEIQQEAAALMQRFETASPSEQMDIERRAGQLAAELRRLPR